MNLKTRAQLALLLLLIVFAVVVGSWSWKSHLETAELRASAEQGKQEVLVYRTEIDRLQREVDELRDASAKVRASEAAATANKTKAPKSIDLRPFMAKDPAFADMRRRAYLREVRSQYGDLGKLNLPPDQLEKLTNLLVDRMAVPQDARDAALQESIKDGTTEMNKAVNDAIIEAEDQLKTALGPAGYKQLQDAANLSGSEMYLQTSLARDMEGAGLPLSHEQIVALAEANVAYQAAPQDAVQDQAYRAAAASVLSPEQLAVFLDGLSYQKDQQSLVDRAQAAAKQQYGDVNSFSWGFP